APPHNVLGVIKHKSFLGDFPRFLWPPPFSQQPPPIFNIAGFATPPPPKCEFEKQRGGANPPPPRVPHRCGGE
ncbi:hypothetical protein, partial [Bartonella grahamii]|uniref:hypothetical protein n=1 Tax=Bartonella grahamii TaxID=33045 RepID=UPI001ABB23B6